jgi:thiol-disulfide isomerase/thioredoxin
VKFTFVLSLLLLLSSAFSIAQEINKKGIESKNNEEILIGICSYEGISSYMPDFDSKLKAYNPDLKICDELKIKCSDITFTVVLATWCDDSKDQVPVFSKVMSSVSYDLTKINYICVDRTKSTQEYNDTDLKIEKVPTFIIFRNGKEIGRIIETPVQTMEFDLSKIITGS